MTDLTLGSGNAASPPAFVLAAGSSTTVTGGIRVGRNDAGLGTYGKLIIEDTAQVQVGYFGLGEQNGRTGEVIQEGGDVTVSNRLQIGHWPNNTSTYTMEGGSITLTGTPGGGSEKSGIIYLGVDGTGQFYHHGGDVMAHGMSLDNRSNTAGTDTYAMTGGSLTLGPTGIITGNPANTSFLIELGGGTIGASGDWGSVLPMTLTGTNGDVAFDTAGHQITLSGLLSGPGGLNKTGDGTLLLSGADNTYAGNTVVQAGTLALEHAASNNSIAASPVIHVMQNATLDVTGLAGAADLVLADGQMLHGNGTVLGNLGVGIGATVSAGASPGHLIEQGDYTQAGIMLAELGGTEQGVTYDWIDVAGTATLETGAIVRVELWDTFVPALGDRFDILTAAGGITNDDLAGIAFDFGDGLVHNLVPSIVSLQGGAEALRLASVPEPTSLLLAAMGAAAVGWIAMRRSKRSRR